ncbi:hypothetical protein [Falsihalocynthiibacter sp. CO-5D18]|uniref:hypothetical protein n=1 Tax=Falsihalocynthiibacter sp. CO-5D18 TaxID=3240872 RepID=UPI00350F0AD0
MTTRLLSTDVVGIATAFVRKHRSQTIKTQLYLQDLGLSLDEAKSTAAKMQILTSRALAIRTEALCRDPRVTAQKLMMELTQ